MVGASRGPYGRFARYYDPLYQGLVDYEGDVDFLEAVFRRCRWKPRTILDLGCGTGNHDLPLSRRGYAVTGIDRSEAMLSVARKKAAQEREASRIRFVRAGMESFRLGQRFDVVICMFGAFGYLLRSRDSARCLRAVRGHLVPRGLFIFEYWQTSGVKPDHQSWIDRVVGGREILRYSESRFDSRKSRVAMDFRFLVIQDGKLVDRFSELHVCRTYTRREMDRLLWQVGFVRLGEFVAPTGPTRRKRFRRVTPNAFRITAVARPRSES